MATWFIIRIILNCQYNLNMESKCLTQQLLFRRADFSFFVIPAISIKVTVGKKFTAIFGYFIFKEQTSTLYHIFLLKIYTYILLNFMLWTCFTKYFFHCDSEENLKVGFDLWVNLKFWFRWKVVWNPS